MCDRAILLTEYDYEDALLIDPPLLYEVAEVAYRWMIHNQEQDLEDAGRGWMGIMMNLKHMKMILLDMEEVILFYLESLY